MHLRHFGLMYLFLVSGCYLSHTVPHREDAALPMPDAMIPDAYMPDAGHDAGISVVDAGFRRPLLRVEREFVRAEGCAIYGNPGPAFNRLQITSLTSERLYLQRFEFPLYAPEAFGMPLVSGARLLVGVWPDMPVRATSSAVMIRTDSIQDIYFEDVDIPLEGFGALDLDLDPDFISFDEVGYSGVIAQIQVAPQEEFVVMTESGRILSPEEIEVPGLPVLLGQNVYVYRSLLTMADACTPETVMVRIGGEQVIANYSLTSFPNPGGYEAIIRDLALVVGLTTAAGRLVRVYDGMVSLATELARGIVSDTNTVVWDDAAFQDIVMASVDHRNILVTLETDGILPDTEIQIGVLSYHWSDGSLSRVLREPAVFDYCIVGAPFNGCLHRFVL